MEARMHEGRVAPGALARHVGQVADQVRDLALRIAHGAHAAVDVQRHAVLALAQHLVPDAQAVERLLAQLDLVVVQFAWHDQLGHRQSERLFGAVAEGRFGGAVPQGHAAIGMRGDERVG